MLPQPANPPATEACASLPADVAGLSPQPSAGPAQPAEALCGAPSIARQDAPKAEQCSALPFPVAEAAQVSEGTPAPCEQVPTRDGAPSQPSTLNPQPSQPSLTPAQLADAMARRAFLSEVLRLVEQGESIASACAALGPAYGSPALISKLCNLMQDRVRTKLTSAGRLRWLLAQPVAALAPGRSGGRGPEMTFTDGEVRALKARMLVTNRTWNSGSPTVAIESAIRAGELRPNLVEWLRARARAGKDMLTDSLRKQLRISPATTRAYRNPREAHLDLVQSPGSLAFTLNEEGSGHRHLEPGERMTWDDGTKNFVCCVAGLRREGDKCWEKFGVVIGRWQIIVGADHASLYVPGYCHTARPKGSYRAEDELGAMLPIFEEYGVPPQVILENGISRAGLIREALTGLGVNLLHASGPHEKVIESIFNNLWTRLSFVPGQVGRFRGEEGEVDAIIESCSRGATDPRHFFPMLPDVLSALEMAIHEWNTHTVRSRMHGHWRPVDVFTQRSPKVLRPFPKDSAWRFAPAVTEDLLVRRCDVQTSYLLMPGLSLPVNFSAGFLANYLGKRVRFHYNPHAPEMDAMCVLAEDCGEQKAGTPLGLCQQTNLNARHTRRAFGLSDTPDIGKAAMRHNAQALNRTAKAIRPDGKPGVTYHEQRAYHATGERATPLAAGGEGRGEVGSKPAAPTPLQRTRRTPVTEEAFEAQAALLARRGQRKELVPVLDE